MSGGEGELKQQEPDAGIATIGGGTSSEEEERYRVRNESRPEVLERVRAMQWIASAADRATYLERQQAIAPFAPLDSSGNEPGSNEQRRHERH